ncbi:hypothetical protein RBEAN4_0335 [Rickettsia bellii str. RML An4]|uniref:Uncharacterized protein n=1 Tax=Rickettsia bellii str. RML An4 TaxID=1359193 RepID=A0A0F3Q9Y2_RICBE|nr:hypothetical protein RBEAN4_0335 [Rickettsia bellii str. RML An4]
MGVSHCEEHSFDAISGVCFMRLPRRGFAAPCNDGKLILLFFLF